MLSIKLYWFPLELAILATFLLVPSSDAAKMEDCKENGNQCKEFLKPNICGLFVWCYKREKVGDLTNLCTFSSTQFKQYGLQANVAPVPNKKKCKLITDKDSDCVKLCEQLKNTVYLFAGLFHVCLREAISYTCQSTKDEKKVYCGCGQIADGDSLKGKDVEVGAPC